MCCSQDAKSKHVGTFGTLCSDSWDCSTKKDSTRLVFILLCRMRWQMTNASLTDIEREVSSRIGRVKSQNKEAAIYKQDKKCLYARYCRSLEFAHSESWKCIV